MSNKHSPSRDSASLRFQSEALSFAYSNFFFFFLHVVTPKTKQDVKKDLSYISHLFPGSGEAIFREMDCCQPYS